MTDKFEIEVLDFSNLKEIEGVWTPSGFAALLDAMEFDDSTGLGGDDLREICLMSLQDQEPDEAAYIVLNHMLGGALKEGQLRNMSHEMLTEKLWEEYVDPAFHERLFNVGSLLYAALPQSFPKTDAVRVHIKVKASDDGAYDLLTPTPTEPFLVRLLADGMEPNAVLHRLYGEQLAARSFPNAAEIVWIVDAQPAEEMSIHINIISSGYWLDALERTKSYSSNAHPDNEDDVDA